MASIAPANKAAFTAPALPMAKVAVGMPAGICTMESNESMPLSDHGEPPRFVHRLLAIVD